MRTAEAIKKHWCLVFVAYSFLHLECLSASLPQKCPSPQKSIGEAARQQQTFGVAEVDVDLPGPDGRIEFRRQPCERGFDARQFAAVVGRQFHRLA